MVDSGHRFAPSEFLTFIELRGFSNDWRSLDLGDADLEALQVLLMSDPRRFPVVQGTGGLRKLRFAPESWNRGKRGSIRICYVDFREFKVVLLVFAYPKSVKDDLSPHERKTIKELIARQTLAFQRQSGTSSK